MVRFARLVLMISTVHAACEAAALARPAPSPAPSSAAAPGGQAPPDPTAGESYDGRARDPRLADDLLMVPRILLAPPRLLWKALELPIAAFADAEERYHVTDRIYLMFTSRDGTIGVRPQFDWVLSFAPFFGLTFFDDKLLGPGTRFDVTATSGFDYNLWTARVHARPTPLGRVASVDVSAEYTRRDDQLYTGIGEDVTRPLQAARYRLDAIDFGGELKLALAEPVRLGFGADFGLRRFGDGEQFGGDPPITQVYCVRGVSGQCAGGVDERLVPGFHEGTQFVRGTASLVVDSRDSWLKPSSGARLELDLAYSHGLGSDDSSYLRARGDVVGVLDLWHRTHVLLFRVLGDTILSFTDVPVPFSELVVLGGPEELRGFRPGRFRDYSALLATLEYRWPIWMWMDAQLFVDYGGVSGQGFEGFSLSRMRPDYGGGIRIRTSKLFFFRLQTAYSPTDGWQLFLAATTGP